MRLAALTLMICAMLLSGCDSGSDYPQAAREPFVKTWVLAPGEVGALSVSGTVRARVESPLAFQVPGRIRARSADAGQAVESGAVLFRLDPRDLEQGVQEAQASLAGAAAAQRIAQDDLNRHQQLLRHNAVSRQAAEQAELMLREAQARLRVAQARLGQARNALSYADLTAPASGVLVDVTGSLGQVVAIGQAVALLAHAGEREVEVHLPEGLTPPDEGVLRGAGEPVRLRLREAAGAVDAQSRTLRVRYTLPDNARELQLGSIVRVSFAVAPEGSGQFVVPIGAVSERGSGPYVWLLKEGKVTAVAVTLLAVNAETARVAGALRSGDTVVALGTHLLNEGMVVREYQR